MIINKNNNEINNNNNEKALYPMYYKNKEKLMKK